MFKAILKTLSEGKTLPQKEAKAAMDEMMQGNVDGSQIAGLLAMMRLRGETVAEMTGFALSMREHALSFDHSEKNLLDTCGTGGDDLSTFNISTTTAIIVSACNVKVAKHGNRAISSNSGSADVLEALGIPVQATPEAAVTALKEKGLCFLFAPLYHQSMKHVAATRKQLGFKTIFNLLGPLVNPAKASRQMIGVFDTNYAEKNGRNFA
jgi:anthranilate phosphoribosyltransferase